MRTSKFLLVAAVGCLTVANTTAPNSRAQIPTVPTPGTYGPLGDAGGGTITSGGAGTITDTGVKGEATTTGTAPNQILTWKAIGTGGVSTGESDGVSTDGVTHDYFVLTVANPASFAQTNTQPSKAITVEIAWVNPSTDYDLFIHAGTETGPIVGSSAGGAPGTNEIVSIDPTANIDPGTGLPYTTYYCCANYFTVADSTTLPYTGTAVVTKGLTTTIGSYTHSSTPITFSPNTPCKSPTAAQQGEPASRIDAFGHYYISGIEGVPAGVDLWYFDLVPASPTYDPLMMVPIYRGMPDSLTSNPAPAPAGSLRGFGSGGVGGGDVDVAVGFGDYTGPADTGTGENPITSNSSVPAVAMSSLTAANVTVFRSLDLGQTFTKNVIGNALGGVPVNDRQWMQFLGANDVYLEYRNFAEGVAFIQQSIDGGLTYDQPAIVGTIPQTGYIDVDQHDGTVYVGANDGSVSVGKPTSIAGLISAQTTFTKYQATSSTTPANIFFCTRVAQNDVVATADSLTKAQKARLQQVRARAKRIAAQPNVPGVVTYTHNTVYAVYSDGKNIFLVYSLDQAQTWSNPVQVNDPSDTRTVTNLLPWFAPGPTPGTVGIVWYGCAQAANTDTSKYHVFYAYGTDANTSTPNFDVVEASDHFIHAANISLNGLSVTGQSPNRNLIDYFQIQFDPKGAAVIGYTDDHNDFQGFTYVMRQQTGPSALTGADLVAGTPGANLGTDTNTGLAFTQPVVPPNQPGPNGEQVTDFSQDQDIGLLGVTPVNSPVDIQSIKYQSQDVGNGPVIQATMKVSQLNPIPADSTWIMYFTANAPNAGSLAGPTGTLLPSGATVGRSRYSTGLSDRGAQFYVEAVTTAASSPTSPTTTAFQYGYTVRNFDGSLTNTYVGPADSGAFNRQAGTVSVRISVSKLNASLDTQLANNGPDTENPAHYTHIGSGTVLCGLRGQAYMENETSGDVIEDATRGGTEYKIP